MQYIHAIDLNDFYPCHNLRFTGRLQTPNFLAKIDHNLALTHKTIEQFSIDELRVNGTQECVVTPRTMNALFKAAILRRNQKMVNGYDEEILISAETRNSILKISEIELDFEEVRRLYPHQSVSRLSCLWLAERTQFGEKHIKKMLGDVFILNVVITRKCAMSRVDTEWFDMYWNEQKTKYIESYWSGVPFSEKPKWEYLLDGEIQIEDNEQLEYVKQHGNIYPDNGKN